MPKKPALRLPDYHAPPGSTDSKPSPALTAELAKWDAILAQSGLDDIEHRNTDGTISHHLPRSASEMRRNYRADQATYWAELGAWVEQDSSETPGSRWGARFVAIREAKRERLRETRRHAAAMRRLNRTLARLNGPELKAASKDRRILRAWVAGETQAVISARFRVGKDRVAAVVRRESTAMLAALRAGYPGLIQADRSAPVPIRNSDSDRRFWEVK